MKIERYSDFTLLALTVPSPHVTYKGQNAYLLKVDTSGDIYFYVKEERIQLYHEDKELFLREINKGVTKSRFDFHYQIK